MHVEPIHLSDRGGPEELTGHPDPDIEDFEVEAALEVLEIERGAA